MRNWNKFMAGLIAFALVIGLGMYLNRRHSLAPTQQVDSSRAAAQSTDRPPAPAQATAAATGPGEVFEHSDSPQLPREKVEEYLRKHDRNAASLLAAFHVLQDTNYLREAATNFPNDPRVQWTILARDAFPEDRRKWLDNFKASSPTNSLANYLSARDYLQNHQPQAAINEMTAAAGKSQFADFSMDAILDEEDLYRSSGSSPTEIRTAELTDLGEDTIHQLAQFKDLARNLQDLQHHYANAGDTASVQAIAQMGVDFAIRFASADAIKSVINERVGNASHAVVLEALDQNTPYDFLGGETPAQRLADFKQDSASLRDLSKAYSSAFANASDDQRNDYWERIKIYGMIPAMQWLTQQVPTTPNTGN